MGPYSGVHARSLVCVHFCACVNFRASNEMSAPHPPPTKHPSPRRSDAIDRDLPPCHWQPIPPLSALPPPTPAPRPPMGSPPQVIRHVQSAGKEVRFSCEDTFRSRLDDVLLLYKTVGKARHALQ